MFTKNPYSADDSRFYTFLWEEGGDSIPGATDNFGGNPAEYGGLLASNYPSGPPSAAPFTVSQRYNNFHRNLSTNPCEAPTK